MDFNPENSFVRGGFTYDGVFGGFGEVGNGVDLDFHFVKKSIEGIIFFCFDC